MTHFGTLWPELSRGNTSFRATSIFLTGCLISFFCTAGAHAISKATPNGPAPLIQGFAPAIAGVGGQLKIDGFNLGTEADAVVVFDTLVIAYEVDEHTPNEIIVRVPVGAVSGSVIVVSGVNAPLLRSLQSQIERLEGIDSQLIQEQIHELQAQQREILTEGLASSDTIYVSITFGFLTTSPSEIGPVAEDSEGLPYLVGRVIVDLRGVESFDVALNLAAELNADLTGYFPPSNSYVFDLRNPPSGLDGLDDIVRRLDGDPRVQEAWEDMLLEPGQGPANIKFADVDVMDRYRRTRPLSGPEPGSLNGRRDVWATDRIQAPGAWNLLERFIPAREGKPPGRASLFPTKVAVLDTGADEQHPEFTGVRLKKVTITYTPYRIAGIVISLPSAIDDNQAYDGGDFEAGGVQHGTAVASLIGAANGAIIPGARDGDRGMNGLLHNPMEYTVQAAKLRTTADLIAELNEAVLTGARVVNVSWGQRHPINPDNPAKQDRIAEVRRALLAVSTQLDIFQNRLLMVPCAMNNGMQNDPDGLHGHVLALNEKNIQGKPPGGIALPASLGSLPNVITVGAITENDQLAEFSNWGTPVQVGAPGQNNFMAGKCNQGVLICEVAIGDARYTVSVHGTSYAAPLVSGTAALMLGINPYLPPAQLKAQIIATAFRINTTTPAPGPDNVITDWPSLKTGFAVRNVLLNTPARQFGSQSKGNLIRNDQPWTGVSKVVYFSRRLSHNIPSTLRLVEIRRGDGGRAEAFAARQINLSNGLVAPDTRNASLSYDGRWLAYIKNNDLKILMWDSSQLSSYTFSGVTLNQRALQIGPAGQTLIGATVPIPDTVNKCRFRILWLPRGPGGQAQTIASTSPQKCGPNYSPTILLYDVQWSPDNRQWTLAFEAGTRDDFFRASLSSSLSVNPAKIIPIVYSNMPMIALQAQSPDGLGLARTKLPPSDILETTYIGLQDDHQAAIPDELTDIAWAPDASEFAYSTGQADLGTQACLACIITVRRDFRTSDDRKRIVFVDDSKLPRAIGISSVSWQW